jgi:hypothetical protein
VSWGETLSAAGYPQGVTLPRSWRWASATPLAPPARAPAGDGTDAPADSAGNAPVQANAQAAQAPADGR